MLEAEKRSITDHNESLRVKLAEREAHYGAELTEVRAQVNMYKTTNQALEGYIASCPELNDDVNGEHVKVSEAHTRDFLSFLLR